MLLLFQGRHATQDELAASAFQAVNLDQKYNDEPVQVRVTMGKEPRHFMAVFKGKMVIFDVRPYNNLPKNINELYEACLCANIFLFCLLGGHI